MKPDNQWHPAVLYRCCSEGQFALFESIDAIQNVECSHGSHEAPRYQDVKFNYNRGQPIVDCGDFKITIVDVDKQVGTNQS